ncbi:hypothetical protein ACYF6T_39175 [Streptomyces sp. 7R007]
MKKTSVFAPISVEQLLDAGVPLPPGMEPPAPAPRPSLYRRWRWAVLDAIRRVRKRAGFWIAGYEPTDDWDW